MRRHNLQYARSEFHTLFAKMSFDKIFDLPARVCAIIYSVLYIKLSEVTKYPWSTMSSGKYSIKTINMSEEHTSCWVFNTIFEVIRVG